MDVQERQRREQDYHREFAKRHADRINLPVAEDVIRDTTRRPWNAYWTTYDILIGLGLADKRILVPGCGFGEDAIRLALLGAEVFASDLSEELLAIARARAVKAGVAERIHFDAMPAEKLIYENDSVDIIFFNDILHHVHIPDALAEARRVLRPNGIVVANELYTHSGIQRIRESHIISKVIYPRMVKFIYRTSQPYITEDEHKIDEAELALLLDIMAPGYAIEHYLFLEGRLVPTWSVGFSRFDRALLRLMGSAARFMAGRVIISGRIAKTH